MSLSVLRSSPRARQHLSKCFQRCWIPGYSNPAQLNQAVSSHVTPSWNIGFDLQKKGQYFHNKININGQSTKLDEFQSPGLPLQRDSSPHLQFWRKAADSCGLLAGCAEPSVLCLFIASLRVLGLNPVDKCFLPIRCGRPIQGCEILLEHRIICCWSLFSFQGLPSSGGAERRAIEKLATHRYQLVGRLW